MWEGKEQGGGRDDSLQEYRGLAKIQSLLKAVTDQVLYKFRFHGLCGYFECPEFYLYISRDIKDQEGEASATQQSEVCSYRHPSRDVDGAGMVVGNSSFLKHSCRRGEVRRRSGKEAEACGTARRPFPIFKCEPASARCYQLFAQPWKLVDVTVMEANGSFWFCELSKRIHSQRAFGTLIREIHLVPPENW